MNNNMEGVLFMPQIIYTDTLVGSDGLPLNTTYAATYATTDFSNILDAIARGDIQCGTGQIQPVNWKSNPDDDLPWDTDGPSSSNPWKNY